MRQAVLPARQRLDCGDLSPLLSTSASQAASNSTVPRAKAPASWRTPNAGARSGTRLKARHSGIIQRSQAAWKAARQSQDPLS